MDIPDEWMWCHDVLYGFGYRKGDSDKVIRLEDAAQFLGWTVEHRSFRDALSIERQLELDEIYDKLQPFLAERLEKRRKYVEEHPSKYDRITVAQVSREYPKL
jgi:hypothetical protein